MTTSVSFFLNRAHAPHHTDMKLLEFSVLLLIEGIFAFNFDVNNLQSHLINLKRRNDKYLASKFQLDLLGLNFTRLDGFDGRQIISDLRRTGGKMDLKALTGIDSLKVTGGSMFRSNLPPPVIGCWLSHLKVHHLISTSEDENKMHLIFEDDFLADGNAIKLMSDFANSVPDDWDFLYVGHCHTRERCTRFVPGFTNMCYTDKMVWCLQAYLLRNKGVAKKLYDLGNSPVPLVADHYFQKAKLNIYMVFPHIFKQRKNIIADINSGGIFTNLLNDSIEILVNRNFK